MLVFDKIKFCYRPIPRSGSSSFYKYIYPILIDADILDDGLTSAEVRLAINTRYDISPDEITETIIEKYFIASIVRNPWHRAVSAWKRLIQSIEFGGDQQYYKNRGVQSYSTAFKLMEGDTSFKSFVHYIKNIERNHSEWADQHWRSQAGILSLEGGCPIKYDVIGRLESIKTDFLNIASKLNGPTEFPKIESSGIYDYKEQYTTKLIDDVGEYYTRDVAIFNYEYTV